MEIFFEEDTKIKTFEDVLELISEIEISHNATAETCFFSNGVMYEGLLQDGLFNGQGKLTWPDGTRYIGTFKDGVCNKGKITIINKDKNITNRRTVYYKIDQTNINKINSSDLKKFNMRYKETINCKDKKNQSVVKHQYGRINNDAKTKLTPSYLGKTQDKYKMMSEDSTFQEKIIKKKKNYNYYESKNFRDKNNNTSKTTSKVIQSITKKTTIGK